MLLLLLGAAAVSGWLYGIHWKRIASGAAFSKSEKLIIQLQDQIDVLTEQNGELTKRVTELTTKKEGDATQEEE